MEKIKNATEWMIKLAKDESHGYDQIYRWGPDYDCSSAIITAWEQAGVPVKSRGATYTGNMYHIFKQCGFHDVTSTINLSSGYGLQYGDVLEFTNMDEKDRDKIIQKCKESQKKQRKTSF